MTALVDRLRSIPPALRFGLAALVQLGAVAMMVAGQAAILRNGVEVTLATAPVDPRDFLRGDYVILAYEISTLDGGKLEHVEPVQADDIVYVTLARADSGLYEARALAKQLPAATPERPVLRGRVRSSSCSALDQCKRISVDYGLESYFVPEGQGRVLETMRKERLQVVAAVTPDGRARIKRLLVDGEMIYEEPPF